MTPNPSLASRLQLPHLPLRGAAVALLAMILAAVLAWLATPQLSTGGRQPDLDAMVPKAFGSWRLLPNAMQQVQMSQGVQTSTEQPYDRELMRTYVNDRGEIVMLALAWGERQRQDVKVHRPEVCYPAQGLNVMDLRPGSPLLLQGVAQPVPTVQLLAGNRGQMEAVRYWIRIGDTYGGDGLRARWYILNEGLRGRIPDGLLVRASQRLRSDAEAEASQQLLAGFLSEMTAAVAAADRGVLAR